MYKRQVLYRGRGEGYQAGDSPERDFYGNIDKNKSRSYRGVILYLSLIHIFATNEEGEHGFLLRGHGEMLAAVAFDKALYEALLEKALETIDALSPADVIIDTEWARAMVERL